jgi:hypothetical protein
MTHIKFIRRSVWLLSRESFRLASCATVIAEVLETFETLKAFWTASGHIAEAPTNLVNSASSIHVMAEVVMEERSQRNRASSDGIAGLPACLQTNVWDNLLQGVRSHLTLPSRSKILWEMFQE